MKQNRIGQFRQAVTGARPSLGGGVRRGRARLFAAASADAVRHGQLNWQAGEDGRRGRPGALVDGSERPGARFAYVERAS